MHWTALAQWLVQSTAIKLHSFSLNEKLSSVTLRLLSILTKLKLITMISPYWLNQRHPVQWNWLILGILTIAEVSGKPPCTSLNANFHTRPQNCFLSWARQIHLPQHKDHTYSLDEHMRFVNKVMRLILYKIIYSVIHLNQLWPLQNNIPMMQHIWPSKLSILHSRDEVSFCYVLNGVVHSFLNAVTSWKR